MARILFLHGLESKPGGSKSRFLAERYGAVTPALGCSAPLEPRMIDAALAVARAAIAEHDPELIVGSSFGGAITVRLLREGDFRGPAVLIAPAARKITGDDALPDGTRALILHGDLDEVVPHEDSVALAKTGGWGVELRTVHGGDHRLNVILEDGQLAAAIDQLLAEQGE
jgi:alpha/beta superfamily hydrolase